MMSNKITIPLLVIVSGLAVFLGFQNIKLIEQLEQLSNNKEHVQITPANPTSASPFDQPNNDPLANPSNPNAEIGVGVTTMNFEKMVHNFGTITEGEKVKTTFKFTNTGDKPLIITNAAGSCGCTVPQWPKEPVKPGEDGEIAVEFDSNGKRGENEKNVTVMANTNPASTLLIIKATVAPKDK